MAKAKKNIARWVLQGISVFGIFLGLMCAYMAIAIPVATYREGSASRWFAFAFSALSLVLGAWLARACYLMLRRRSFEAIRSIFALVAIVVFGSVVDPLYRFAAASISGVQARAAVGLVCYFAALALAVLVYWTCTMLLKRLVKAAYGSEEPSAGADSAG